MWAFSDESERANTMLLGTLVVPAAAVAPVRRELRALLLPGQRRVHTAKESPRRRRLLLDVVAGLEATAVVHSIRRPVGMNRIEARRHLLDAVCRDLLDRRVTSWVLDGQDTAQATRDRMAIDAALREVDQRLVYDHRSSHDEPLLWAIDAITWSIGAGGDWHRRIDHLVEMHPVEP